MYDFVKRKKERNKQTINVDVYSDIYRRISLKFGTMIMTTKFYTLIPVLMTSTVRVTVV